MWQQASTTLMKVCLTLRSMPRQSFHLLGYEAVEKGADYVIACCTHMTSTWLCFPLASSPGANSNVGRCCR